MSNPPPFIIDAGPALNFLASGHQHLLSHAIGNNAVHAPESVETEVLRKARKTSKFKGVEGRWRNMKPTWLHLLSDNSTDYELLQAAQHLLPTSLAVRQQDGDDLGETMVVLHAYAKALAGEVVVVIIDDRNARQFALTAQNRIKEARRAGTTTGRINLTSTKGLINARINTPDIPTQDALQQIWDAISPMDDGLEEDLPAKLRDSPRWTGPQRP